MPGANLQRPSVRVKSATKRWSEWNWDPLESADCNARNIWPCGGCRRALQEARGNATKQLLMAALVAASVPIPFPGPASATLPSVSAQPPVASGPSSSAPFAEGKTPPGQRRISQTSEPVPTGGANRATQRRRSRDESRSREYLAAAPAAAPAAEDGFSRNSFCATFGSEERKLDADKSLCPTHSYMPAEKLSTLKSTGAVAWKQYHPTTTQRAPSESVPHSYASPLSTLKTAGAVAWGKVHRTISPRVEPTAPHSYASPLSTLKTAGAIAWRAPHKPRELPKLAPGGSHSAPASVHTTPVRIRKGDHSGDHRSEFVLSSRAGDAVPTPAPLRARRLAALDRLAHKVDMGPGSGYSVSAPKMRMGRSRDSSGASNGSATSSATTTSSKSSAPTADGGGTPPVLRSEGGEGRGEGGGGTPPAIRLRRGAAGKRPSPLVEGGGTLPQAPPPTCS